MAARHAPLPLAELICELAAPEQQPTILKVQAVHEDIPTHTLALHIRPCPHAAGLEAAVHAGSAVNEEGNVAELASDGALLAWDETVGSFTALRLPEEHMSEMWQPGWDRVELELYPPEAVALAAGFEPASEGRANVRFPLRVGPSLLASAAVANAAPSYAREQRQLKQARSGRADSEEAYRAKHRRLQEEAAESLVAALVAMLRQACRYRGRQPLFAAGAGAAPDGAQQEGQPAEGQGAQPAAPAVAEAAAAAAGDG
ncbi:hypothetical protein ABPG75_003624 [Micractinium tetrahymenae]